MDEAVRLRSEVPCDAIGVILCDVGSTVSDALLRPIFHSHRLITSIHMVLTFRGEVTFNLELSKSICVSASARN